MLPSYSSDSEDSAVNGISRAQHRKRKASSLSPRDGTGRRMSKKRGSSKKKVRRSLSDSDSDELRVTFGDRKSALTNNNPAESSSRRHGNNMQKSACALGRSSAGIIMKTLIQYSIPDFSKTCRL